MESKLRNLLFALAFVVVSFGPIGLFCCKCLDIELPSWLTAEDALYLTGENSNSNLMQFANIDGFVSGNLQSSFEKEVEGLVPTRAFALLGTSALQRTFVDLSNFFFEWECEPSFYGSEFVFNEPEQRLYQMPAKATEYMLGKARRSAIALNSLADGYPDKGVYVYLAANSQYFSCTPLMQLMSNELTYDKIEETFIDNDQSFIWISGDVTREEFLRDWFASDHHWKATGAYGAYRRIADAMGFTPLSPKAIVKYETPRFYGSLARRALLDNVSDEMDDCIFDSDSLLKVRVGEEEGGAELLVRRDLFVRQDALGENKFTNRYGELYHGDAKPIVIENEGKSDADDLLIIADSYSNCFEHMIASHFGTTYVLDPRHADCEIDEFLDAHPDIGSVLVLAVFSDLTSDEFVDFLGNNS